MLTQAQGSVMIGIGLAILVAVVILVVVLVRSRQNPQNATKAFADAVDNSLKQLGEGVQHYVDVSTVLVLTEKFKQNPELVQNLKGYTDQAVAAALTHKVNSLGRQLVVTMNELEDTRQVQSRTYSTSYDVVVKRLESMVEHLEQELWAARDVVRQFSSVTAGTVQSDGLRGV